MKHDTWRKEQEEVRGALQRHERANTNYYEEGVGILELAQQAYSLYVGASPQNKRDIVRSLLSNCTLNDTTLCPTYRKPYQLLRDALKTKEWGPLPDSASNKAPWSGTLKWRKRATNRPT